MPKALSADAADRLKAKHAEFERVASEIALQGRRGSGKSTLLNALLHRMKDSVELMIAMTWAFAPTLITKIWITSRGSIYSPFRTLTAYSVDLSVLDHDTMRPAGFEVAQELNTSDLTLLDAATCTVTHAIGRGLRNWTKRMPQREFEALLA